MGMNSKHYQSPVPQLFSFLCVNCSRFGYMKMAGLLPNARLAIISLESARN